MIKNIHRVLSSLSPKQKMWVVSLSIVGSVVGAFAPGDGFSDKLFSLIDGFTYDDTEMRTQLNLQRNRLKLLILENDSLSSVIMNQSNECRILLTEKNKEFNNTLLEIENAFNSVEREQTLNKLKKPKSVKIVQTQKEKLNVKYDTVIRRTTQSQNTTESTNPITYVENEQKSWIGKLFTKKKKTVDYSKTLNQIQGNDMVVTNIDTIVTPVYLTEHVTVSDTFNIVDDTPEQTTNSLNRLKNLIKKKTKN